MCLLSLSLLLILILLNYSKNTSVQGNALELHDS